MVIAEIIKEIAIYTGYLLTIYGVVKKVIHPIKEHIEGQNASMLCLIRSSILDIYYRGLENQKQITQYDFENAMKLYDQYLKLGGNSFVAEVIRDIKEFEVIR